MPGHTRLKMRRQVRAVHVLTCAHSPPALAARTRTSHRAAQGCQRPHLCRAQLGVRVHILPSCTRLVFVGQLRVPGSNVRARARGSRFWPLSSGSPVRCKLPMDALPVASALPCASLRVRGWWRRTLRARCGRVAGRSRLGPVRFYPHPCIFLRRASASRGRAM